MTTYQDLKLESHLSACSDSSITTTYSMFSHRMRIQLLICRDGHDAAGSFAYKACLACKSTKDKRPFSIRLVMTGLGQFRRVVAYTQKEIDPGQLESSDIQNGQWTLTSVYIPSPQPSIALRQSLKVHTCDELPVFLDSIALSQAGLLLKLSSWEMETVGSSGKFAFKIDRTDWDMIAREDVGDQTCGALIFRDSKTKSDIGVALTISGFRLHATFIDAVPSSHYNHPFKARKLGIRQWQEASISMLSKELSDGRVVFVSSEDDFDKGIVLLKIGMREKSESTYSKIRAF